jgi:hypothetical protein
MGVILGIQLVNQGVGKGESQILQQPMVVVASESLPWDLDRYSSTEVPNAGHMQIACRGPISGPRELAVPAQHCTQHCTA